MNHAEFVFSESGVGEQRMSPMPSQESNNGLEISNEDVSVDNLSEELRTVHQVADSMGGTLSVCSTSRGGRLIWFQVSVACGVAQGEKAAVTVNTMQKIMIIEEPHGTQEMAINYLRTKGLCVDRFRSGIEGIQAAKASHYIMIFIDGRLPDMSGQDIA